MTREEWLLVAYGKLSPLFESHGTLPAKVAILTSWAPKRSKREVLGACYPKSWTENEMTYITITPEVGKEDKVQILGILMHEMIHALGIKGHRKDFGKVAKPLGLLAPWTTLQMSEELTSRFDILAKELPEYPHQKMTPPPKEKNDNPKTNGGALKFQSPENPKYTVFIYKKWLEEFGPPICPISHEAMIPFTKEEKE